MRAFIAAFLLLIVSVSTSEAFHQFRGDEKGGCSTDEGNFTGPPCCPASGQRSDDPLIPDTNIHITGPVGATVLLLHQSFNDAQSLAPGVVVIHAGEAVEWKWASYHCHSVTGSLPFTDPGAPLAGAGGTVFDSGFLYPSDTPPKADMMGLAATPGVPGALDYPIPDLDNQTLSFVHTFNDPGYFPYHCIHHQEIGMGGVVIVLPKQ
jgi:plastocyanin